MLQEGIFDHAIINKMANRNGRVFIDCDLPSEHDPEVRDNFTVNRSTAALPEFYQALAALRPHIADILGLSAKWCDDIDVRAVSFTLKNEIMGATITGVKPCPRAQSPFNLHTPHMPAAPYQGGDDTGYCLSKKAVQALEEVQHQCRLYLNGSRAQMTLFASGNDEEDIDESLPAEEGDEGPFQVPNSSLNGTATMDSQEAGDGFAGDEDEEEGFGAENEADASRELVEA